MPRSQRAFLQYVCSRKAADAGKRWRESVDKVPLAASAGKNVAPIRPHSSQLLRQAQDFDEFFGKGKNIARFVFFPLAGFDGSP